MRIIGKITDSLVKGNIIEEQDKELYSYGMQQGLMTLLNFATAIAVGFVLNMVWQTIIFTFAYLPVRIYAGGFHAKTQLRCYLVSILLLIAVLLDIKYLSYCYLIAQLIISIVIIIIFSPVEDTNKPLSNAEKIKYRRIAIINAVILSILGTTLGYFNLHIISDSIILGVVSSGLMLILGKIKNCACLNKKSQFR